MMTGTPIQNNMQELWVLLHFLDPINFNHEDRFLDKYGEDNLIKNQKELQKV